MTTENTETVTQATTVTDSPAEQPETKELETGTPETVETSTADKIGDLIDNIGKPAEKPAETAKPGESVAKPSEDDKPPEDAGPRAKSRWMELSERAKAVPVLEERATKAETELASVRDMVKASGLDQTEFQGMLQIGRMFKSSDPKDLQAALQELDAVRADVAKRLGVEAPGVDMLADHPDLQAEVDDMAISRERAVEIAGLRNAKAKLDQEHERTSTQTQFMATVQTAASQMDVALAQRAATPGHAAKVEWIKAQLSDPVKMQQFVSTYQPGQWQAAVMMMYDAYTPPAVQQAVPQPLRPGVVASGVRQTGSKAMTSTDAVNNAWEAAGL